MGTARAVTARASAVRSELRPSDSPETDAELTGEGPSDRERAELVRALPLVGRDAGLRALEDQIRACLEQRGGIISVIGPPTGCMCSESATCHSRTVPSSLPLTTSLPFGVTDTE